MIPRETIQKILEAGVEAPSGENAQPWRFEVGDDVISLFDVPERDRSLYNFRNRASHIAHGAVIQNMVIAASQFGCVASVSLFPEKNSTDLVARVALQPASPNEEPLYLYIFTRSTNRKLYYEKPIPGDVLASLVAAAHHDANDGVMFITEREKIDLLADAASANDQIMLENRDVHDFFFSHVHWSLEEEEKQRSGFYIEVLELAPPVKKLFHIFKRWSMMRILNGIGMAKAGAAQNVKIYASAPAIGAFLLHDDLPESFVKTGMAFQKLWLSAAKAGLYLQPLTGVIFFHQRIMGGDAGSFSAAHRELIAQSYKTIESIFTPQGGPIGMMFRIGYADAPSAHSLKMPATAV